MKPVIVTANLIVGKDGSTSISGSSTPLSTQEDRERFQALRLKNDLILIGGNTARREPYKKTPIPLYILTHTKVRLQPKNQLAKQFSLSIKEMISEIGNKFEGGKEVINLLVEAGPSLLTQMISDSLIDQFYLTINLELTGDNQISISDLTCSFELVESEIVGSCEFRIYKKLAK
ncbi:MAG: dihydrofolate reductase family protein [Candidatus Nanopelagicus sp.]|jgi:riboflavin biosynthesis pyrimidine reductase